ncbi:transglutaminaseTgpA domain-containing protein [Streptomyces axinellae]|uniref:Transglutaminase-like domain-containing protein n=1 Tax=Streptomyces axinellae TaxID=552788 RepID=A0ABP6D8T0_9ACTN
MNTGPRTGLGATTGTTTGTVPDAATGSRSRTGPRAGALPGQRPAAYDGPSWAPPRPVAPGGGPSPGAAGPPGRPEADAEGGAGGRSAVSAVAPPHALPRARRLWSLLPVAGLAAGSGLGFHRVFGTGALVPVVAVAVLVPMALSTGLLLLQSRKGRPAPLWPSLVLGAVVWLVVACATLFRSTGGGLPTGEAVAACWAALLDSPHATLTTILPAPPEPDFLVLPYAVVWPASLAATELALRTRAPLLPALPPVLAFGFPLVLGADGPGTNRVTAAALVAWGAVLVLLRSPAARRSAVGTLAVGLPVVAVLALAAALLGPRLPGLDAREPYDLRERVEPPTVHPQSTSPLDQISAWLQHPETRLFTVRAPGGHNWRLAVLDRYDGVKWTSGAELARSGGRVPPERGAGPGRARRVEQQFTLQGLPGMWLPAADRPTAITSVRGAKGGRSTGGRGAAGQGLPGGDLAVDPDSGVVATGTGGAPGTRANSGLSYTAVSREPQYDIKRLQYAAAPGGGRYTRLPRTDAAGKPIASLTTFTKLAATATAGSSYPYQQAYRLAAWLREHYRYDPTSVPGHAYRNLEFFLTTGKHGTSEQFAAAFAVMARSLGLPTRVTVGFRSGEPKSEGQGNSRGGAGKSGASGIRQVTGRDALAWPEVRFQGIGWVPFYPTPGHASKDRASVPPAGQPEKREKADRDVAEQPRPSVPPERKDGDKKSDRHDPASGTGHGLPAWAFASLAVLLLTAAYCLLAAWAPYRRRGRRRGARDPGQRVLGAWRQSLDRLTEIGLPPTPAHTATEVAAFGTARLGDAEGEGGAGGAGGRQLAALARLVNEVGYGGRAADSAAADAAWRHCDAVEEVVARAVPRRIRIRRALRPRTVFRRLRHRGESS